jgi:hypothetical protein
MITAVGQGQDAGRYPSESQSRADAGPEARVLLLAKRRELHRAHSLG